MMKKERILILLSCIAFTASMLFSFMVFGFESETSGLDMSYSDTLFDDTTVHSINLIADTDEWQSMLDNALYETYIACDVVIDGEVVSQVGIRPKGNASLTNVALDETTDRFSFKISFDEYIDGQSFYGLNALSLNNGYNDKSYMKEFIAYELYEFLGVPVPEASFVNVTLNGENLGLYLAVEPMEESYLINNFGSLEGQLFKPEVGDMADRFTGQGDPNAFSGNTNLTDLGDTVEDYTYLFDNQVFGESHSNNQEVMLEFLETIQSGTIDETVDVESVLKYTAVTAFTANFDSYLGKRANNYYLYENEEVVSLLPWDLNMAFGGLGVTDGAHAINISVIEPYFTTADQYPLISSVLENPDYMVLYQSYLQDLVDYVNNGNFDALVLETDALISDYVKMDSTAFFDDLYYEESIPALLTFAEDKALAVSNQLSGDFTQVNTTFELGDLSNAKHIGDHEEAIKDTQTSDGASNKGGEQTTTSGKGSGSEVPDQNSDKGSAKQAVSTDQRDSTDKKTVGDGERSQLELTGKGNNGGTESTGKGSTPTDGAETRPANNLPITENQDQNSTAFYFITSMVILLSALLVAIFYKRS